MTTTIEMQTGSVNNSKGQMTVTAFVRDGYGKDVPIHVAVKDPKSQVSEPGGIVNSTPSHKSSRVSGAWTTRRIECEDAVYLKFVVRKVVADRKFGGLPEQSLSAFMIRARATAPLRELRLELPTDANATLSYLYITGRFDMVEPQELVDNKLYLTGQQNDLKLFDPDNHDYLEERQIEAEIAPMIKAKAVTEGSKTLTRPMRHRRIRITKR